MGKASGEGKITDAKSGELLLAGVDRRAGSKNVKGSFNAWNDVEEVNLYWAYQVRYPLGKLRQRLDEERGLRTGLQPLIT